MEEDYVGVIVEPWELEDSFTGYSDTAMHQLHDLDRKCLLVEDTSLYGEGEFDLVSYDDFSDYVGEDPAFITGDPEMAAEAADLVDHGDVVLDENVFVRGAVDIPSSRRTLKEGALSLIPMYEPERQNVEVTTSEDVLRALGLEDADLMPLHALR